MVGTFNLLIILWRFVGSIVWARDLFVFWLILLLRLILIYNVLKLVDSGLSPLEIVTTFNNLIGYAVIRRFLIRLYFVTASGTTIRIIIALRISVLDYIVKPEIPRIISITNMWRREALLRITSHHRLIVILGIYFLLMISWDWFVFMRRL